MTPNEKLELKRLSGKTPKTIAEQQRFIFLNEKAFDEEHGRALGTAPAPTAPKAYAEMTFMERARLARSDPQRFRELRAAREATKAELQRKLWNARSLAERNAIREELEIA